MAASICVAHPANIAPPTLAGATAPDLLSEQAALRVRQLRHRLRMSRPAFAAALGIPPSTLKNYELGYRQLGGSFFLLVANHPSLQVHTLWLLTGAADSCGWGV
ncbi:MAG: helix-turn-helix domain-containing protein [Shewanella sp.]